MCSGVASRARCSKGAPVRQSPPLVIWHPCPLLPGPPSVRCSGLGVFQLAPPQVQRHHPLGQWPPALFGLVNAHTHAAQQTNQPAHPTPLTPGGGWAAQPPQASNLTRNPACLISGMISGMICSSMSISSPPPHHQRRLLPQGPVRLAPLGLGAPPHVCQRRAHGALAGALVEKGGSQAVALGICTIPGIGVLVWSRYRVWGIGFRVCGFRAQGGAP